MLRFWMVGLIAFAAGGCTSASYRLLVTTAGGSNIAPSYVVGDTLRMLATEWEQRFLETEEPTRSSDRLPSDFQWTTADGKVVEVLAPAVALMRGVGTTTLRVKTSRSSATITLHVVAAAGSPR